MALSHSLGIWISKLRGIPCLLWVILKDAAAKAARKVEGLVNSNDGERVSLDGHDGRAR